MRDSRQRTVSALDRAGFQQRKHTCLVQLGPRFHPQQNANRLKTGYDGSERGFPPPKGFARATRQETTTEQVVFAAMRDARATLLIQDCQGPRASRSLQRPVAWAVVAVEFMVSDEPLRLEGRRPMLVRTRSCDRLHGFPRFREDRGVLLPAERGARTIDRAWGVRGCCCSGAAVRRHWAHQQVVAPRAPGRVAKRRPTVQPRPQAEAPSRAPTPPTPPFPPRAYVNSRRVIPMRVDASLREFDDRRGFDPPLLHTIRREIGG